MKVNEKLIFTFNLLFWILLFSLASCSFNASAKDITLGGRFLDVLLKDQPPTKDITTSTTETTQERK